MIRLDGEEKEIFGIDSVTIYKKVIVRGIKYTSLKMNDLSTIDYFVKLKDDRIGAVKYYSILNQKLHALINFYEVANTCGNFFQINRSGNQELIKMNDISEKMIYMKFGLREFVTVPPNNYEKT